MYRLTMRTPAAALALGLLLLAPAFGSMAAKAQGSERAANEQLAEVVVTARRREETLQDVPLAVSAFSAAALEQVGASDIAELAQFVPSVTLEPSRATNSTLTAFIRGVGQQDPLAGFEQGVALYVDDVYIARPQGALLDIFDIERVEILRGPQGTLYGRNAVGGAIKYVTRRLSDNFEAQIKGSVGSYGQLDGVGKIAFPLGDSVRFGATVASLNRDGYGDNLTTGGDNYNKDVLAGRVSLEFLPSDSVFIRLTADYTDDKSDPVAGHRVNAAVVSMLPVLSDLRDTRAGASINASTAGIGGNNQVESKGVHATIEWQLNDAVLLKSITAYREDYTESVIDFDSLAVDDFDAPVIYDNEQLSQELQLQYGGERLDAVVGLYYLDASASNDFDVVLGQTGRLLFGTPLTAYTGGTVDTKAWSAFADATYQVNDRFSLGIGGRYTRDKRSADIFRANYLGVGGSPFFGNSNAIFLAATSDFEASRTFSDFSPRVVAAYEFSPDLNTYVSYSRGFKAGSFDPRGANFSTPEVTRGYEPETLDSYEIGLKSTFLDGRARANLALFYSDYKDMQIPGSIPIDSNNDGINDGFVGAVTNAGQSTIQGIELESELRVTSAFTIQANLSALDPKIDEWIVNGVDVADQRRIQNTPKLMASLGFNVGVPVGTGLLNMNANWSHKGSIVQFEVPVPQIDQEAYNLLNASVVWLSDDGRLTAGLYGKNLTNEDYKTAGYNFPTLGLENNITVFYGAPRTVTLSVGYRWQ